ncbi:MAG TPA: nucleotidyltransferase family protein [Acidiphilium sp.]|nr:MAG: hypothetical protein B7Z67_02055 [Acidiphilium sp. 21-60-14]OYV92142.1 MAG: hypothetical protein B7Z57_01910 [Acidiphilium sp. 37-60-79]HQT89279.1 nucleotidyltransferase family protein [Acidiphilium sp.]HQU23242.1 nucleotidyltransferase family protein [Acidiphilium sp.]
MSLSAPEICAIVTSNAVARIILDRLPKLKLEQAYLAAGAVFQPVWNFRARLPVEYGINDYDIAYFDPDLSYAAEDEVIRRGAALFADIAARIEIRNQARVHLWYPARFGAPYPRLTSCADGISRYLVACTCMGLSATGDMIAPDGYDDLWHGILRPNPRAPSLARFAAKARSYQARWPLLRVVDADGPSPLR